MTPAFFSDQQSPAQMFISFLSNHRLTLNIRVVKFFFFMLSYWGQKQARNPLLGSENKLVIRYSVTKMQW